MLRLIGSHYHFRRAVPVVLQACLGKTEISLSLQTESKFLARQRAAALYARTGEVFHKARTMQGRFSGPILLKKSVAVSGGSGLVRSLMRLSPSGGLLEEAGDLQNSLFMCLIV
jgi:hypothetical protein